MPATLLVATETHFARADDGSIRSTTGVDGYGFWTRYLDVFDHVLVAARTGSDDGATGSRVEGPRVEVAALPDYRGPWGYMKVRQALANTMRRAVARADALCLRAPGPIAGLAWRLRDGRPYGVEVVGDPLDALSPGAVRSAARPLARVALARELRAMCSGAVAVGYVTAGALQRRYPTRGWSTAFSSIQLEDDAFVAAQAVDHRYAAPAIANRGTAGDPWRLIFVGSLAQRYKGLDVLLDALALVRGHGLQAVLTVVGDGKERSIFEAQSRARGVEASVTFAGQIPPSKVRELLDAADLFVLPSRTEGLPRAMLEAMARGVACVGTAVGGIPELLPVARLARKEDARGLGRVIQGLCGCSEQLAMAAAADRESALRYRAAVLGPRRIACHRHIRRALFDGDAVAQRREVATS